MLAMAMAMAMRSSASSAAPATLLSPRLWSTGPRMLHVAASRRSRVRLQVSAAAAATNAAAASPAGKLYLETYGCQMNFNDLEVVLSILNKAGYNQVVELPEQSDVILINTCAIRENAENKIWQRLNFFKNMKTHWKRDRVGEDKLRRPPKVAVLGCMAERLKERLIEAHKMVDVVCGPDAYRDLPRLLESVEQGPAAVNTLLSLEETYADVSPVRISKDSVTAFVSIMRGCNNMCSYCIVPFTRGRERSRPIESIVREVGEIWEDGVREVTLLGQNVNSYADLSAVEADPAAVAAGKKEFVVVGEGKNATKYFKSDALSPGFSTIYPVKDTGLRFAELLDRLAVSYPEMRFRFTSPHPKDFPDDLLFVMRDRPNICKSIHLPAQSGSTRILEKMRRGYTREAYLELVDRIRSVLPDVGLSSDFIAGYCGETEEEHQETLSLIEAVGYEMAYMFAYSMREKTHAHRTDVDDVPEEVKQRRLSELIATFRRTTASKYTAQVGQTQLVLVESSNKRNDAEWGGRNDRGQKVYFPKTELLEPDTGCSRHTRPGDYVAVKISETTHASLRGEPVQLTGLQAFYSSSGGSQVGKISAREALGITWW